MQDEKRWNKSVFINSSRLTNALCLCLENTDECLFGPGVIDCRYSYIIDLPGFSGKCPILEFKKKLLEVPHFLDLWSDIYKKTVSDIEKKFSELMPRSKARIEFLTITFWSIAFLYCFNHEKFPRITKPIVNAVLEESSLINFFENAKQEVDGFSEEWCDDVIHNAVKSGLDKDEQKSLFLLIVVFLRGLEFEEQILPVLSEEQPFREEDGVLAISFVEEMFRENQKGA